MKSRSNHKRTKINKTIKRKNNNVNILAFMMSMNDTIKLYHWETRSYSHHKATDDLYESLSGLVDNFIEVLLGKLNTRFQIPNSLKLSIPHFKSTTQLIKQINYYKSYLLDIENKLPKGMTNPDLLTIRDEMLAQLNKFLYLLTLK